MLVGLMIMTVPNQTPPVTLLTAEPGTHTGRQHKSGPVGSCKFTFRGVFPGIVKYS